MSNDAAAAAAYSLTPYTHFNQSSFSCAIGACEFSNVPTCTNT